MWVALLWWAVLWQARHPTSWGLQYAKCVADDQPRAQVHL